MSVNKPAYPCYSSETENHESGLTKREYFAAMALNGDFASQGSYCGEFKNSVPDDLIEKRVILYLRFADAIIKASQVQS